MTTIRSLFDAVDLLKREPMLFVPGFVYAIVILPESALSLAGIPFLPALLQFLTFFAAPLFVAGTLGMVFEGRAQDTSLETFRRIGVDRYLSVLLGMALMFVIRFVFLAILLVSILVGFVALLAGTTTELNELALDGPVLVVGAVALVLLVVYIAVRFFLQFYAAAIVYEDVGVVDGLTRSVDLVGNNFVAVLGFSALRTVVFLLVSAPVVAITLGPFLLETGTVEPGVFQGFSFIQARLTLVLLGSAVLLVATTIVEPFRLAFTGSFYAEHR
jgi:hypothetical protein